MKRGKKKQWKTRKKKDRKDERRKGWKKESQYNWNDSSSSRSFIFDSRESLVLRQYNAAITHLADLPPTSPPPPPVKSLTLGTWHSQRHLKAYCSIRKRSRKNYISEYRQNLTSTILTMTTNGASTTTSVWPLKPLTQKNASRGTIRQWHGFSIAFEDGQRFLLDQSFTSTTLQLSCPYALLLVFKTSTLPISPSFYVYLSLFARSSSSIFSSFLFICLDIVDGNGGCGQFCDR